MGSRQILLYFSKMSGNSACLYATGNDSIEKETLLIRKEKRWLLELCLWTGEKGCNQEHGGGFGFT